MLDLTTTRKTALRPESTKSCPVCNNTHLATYLSFGLKACYDCRPTVWMVWDLNEGQKKLIQHQRG